MKVNVVFRMEKKDLVTLDQLTRAQGTDRSTLIRKAVKSFLAEYTGEPDLHQLSKDVGDLKSRVSKMEAFMNDLRH